MTISPRYLVALFVLLHVMGVRDALAARVGPRHGRSLLAHGNILTDYIGASGSAIQFTDVPLSPGVSYIFPLSFAIDADAQGNVANGVFSPYWSSSLTPEAAQAFVQANSNVRLAVSLAGFSQFISATETRNVDWYDPADTGAWIAQAVSSISALASQYSITGVDIDYENFPQSSTFTTCIGGLITGLKSAGPITTASIAPFGATRAIYTDLFQSAGDSIDYVNYQFYADGLTTPDAFVAEFNDVANTFGASKLLASVEANGRGLQGQDFIGAVQQLSEVAGIMVFDVDTDEGQQFATTQAAATFLAS